MPGDRNLIIGFWSGLPFGELEPFLASLRNTGFDGDLCILVDNVTAETVRQLVAHGVVVERLGQSAQSRMASQCSCFFAYLDFLARHEDRYRHVMLADLRNVVFQSDPFAQPFPSDVVFAHERCRLVDSAMNRRWVEQAYGRPVAENMRNCLVSHTGATFGTIGGVLKYLTAMTSELTSRPVAMEEGIEQGVHNYVVHVRPPRGGWLEKFPRASRLSNGPTTGPYSARWKRALLSRCIFPAGWSRKGAPATALPSVPCSI